MTGQNTGTIDANFDYKSAGYISVSNTPPTSTGSITTTYDGTTRSGPPGWVDDKSDKCPASQVPPLPQLKATAKRLSPGRYLVKVTTSITGAGPNETGVEIAPVTHARITGADKPTYTNDNGTTIITIHHHQRTRRQLKVTAGDTLQPTTLSVNNQSGNPRAR